MSPHIFDTNNKIEIFNFALIKGNTYYKVWNLFLKMVKNHDGCYIRSSTLYKNSHVYSNQYTKNLQNMISPKEYLR
jgi:hypothetical protein